jgi:hypothetical protein
MKGFLELVVHGIETVGELSDEIFHGVLDVSEPALPDAESGRIAPELE